VPKHHLQISPARGDEWIRRVVLLRNRVEQRDELDRFAASLAAPSTIAEEYRTVTVAVAESDTSVECDRPRRRRNALATLKSLPQKWIPVKSGDEVLLSKREYEVVVERRSIGKREAREGLIRPVGMANS
jgi:hypothetical protein